MTPKIVLTNLKLPFSDFRHVFNDDSILAIVTYTYFNEPKYALRNVASNKTGKNLESAIGHLSATQPGSRQFLKTIAE